MASRIVVVGASFGGLNAAYELKRLLGTDANVTVVAKSPDFLFIPSLIWVVPNRRAPGQISFPLGPALRRKGIAFSHATVTRFDPDQDLVETDGGTLAYDYLVIATGPSYDWERVPGLADGHANHWAICDLAHSMEAARGWIDLLQDPGPVVVGTTQASSHFVPDYEIALNVEWSLRRARIRDMVDVTFVTPEPHLGHFGIGGVGRSQRAIETMFRRRGITAITGVATEGVEPDRIRLSGGLSVPYKYAILTPPYRGVEAIRNSPGLGDEHGLIPVDDRLRHERFSNVYAVGVTVAVPPMDGTPVPINVPRTGWMSEGMGKTAAANIAAELRGAPLQERPFAEHRIQYLLDGGDTGLLVASERVFAPRRFEFVLGGPWVHWMKVGFERYYMTKMRWGLSRLP